MHLRPTAFNMAMQISKYTYLGMPFEKVIKAATWNNAENMGISDRVGSLKEENRLILQCSEYMKVKMYSATDRIQMRQLHLEKAIGCSNQYLLLKRERWFIEM